MRATETGRRDKEDGGRYDCGRGLLEEEGGNLGQRGSSRVHFSRLSSPHLPLDTAGWNGDAPVPHLRYPHAWMQGMGRQK